MYMQLLGRADLDGFISLLGPMNFRPTPITTQKCNHDSFILRILSLKPSQGYKPGLINPFNKCGSMPIW